MEIAVPPADLAPIRLEREGDVALVVIDNPPVNAGSAQVRAGLIEAVRAVDADPGVRAAVLIGAGGIFMAGADIREFSQPIADPDLPTVIAAIEASPKTFVAAVHGAALGGGLELALGCDFRIATASAVLGLPEVSLGIIPGAGGTQRLPRLVGVSTAIELICGAIRMSAPDALTRGVVESVCTNDDLRRSALALARARAGQKRRLGDVTVPPEPADTIDKTASACLRSGRHRPHITAAIEAVRWAASTPLAEGLARERAAFHELRATTEAAALRYLFFAERAAAKVPGLDGVEPDPVAQVGVVGAGTMGTGIAMCVADAGLPCLLTDQDAAGVDRGMARIRDLYQRAVAAGRLSTEEADSRLARIRPVSSIGSLAGSDLVIEAVFEDMATKTAVFRSLDASTGPRAILATNTSYMDVNAIAEVTTDPSRVLGLHFFAPANVMRLLEVVRGRATSPNTLATALAVARRLRKLAVVAGVCEGFIGNRIYGAYRKQCEFMLEEGAFPEEVDAALERFGFPMGPFAVGDMSGLDIAWRMRQRLAPTRDPRARYCELPDRLCERGRLGQKTGAGWYRYAAGDRKGQVDEVVHAIILAHAQAKGVTRRTFSADEIVERVLVTMTNEIATLVEDGIAMRASDADLVLVNGYGFPRHEGGPVFWASRQPRARLAAQRATLREVTGHGFREGNVEALLEQWAAQQH